MKLSLPFFSFRCRFLFRSFYFKLIGHLHTLHLLQTTDPCLLPQSFVLDVQSSEICLLHHCKFISRLLFAPFFYLFRLGSANAAGAKRGSEPSKRPTPNDHKIKSDRDLVIAMCILCYSSTPRINEYISTDDGSNRNETVCAPIVAWLPASAVPSPCLFGPRTENENELAICEAISTDVFYK